MPIPFRDRHEMERLLLNKKLYKERVRKIVGEKMKSKKMSKVKTSSKKKTITKKVSTPKKKTTVHKKKILSKPEIPFKKIVKKNRKKNSTLPQKKFGIPSTENEVEAILSHVIQGHREEIKIEGAKFEIGVVHNAQAMPVKDIPLEYGKNSVTLLTVDPRFVFAYWEVRHDTLFEASRQIGSDAKLTLRFYDITDSGDTENSPFWDVEVFDRLGNWYLKLERPEQRLCLDIGMKSLSGRFVRICRSNLLRLPPQSLARPGPIKWMVVTASGDKLISEREEYTDADLSLLKRILGPFFFDLLMRGRFASLAGSSLEAVFYNVEALRFGESPAGKVPWASRP